MLNRRKKIQKIISSLKNKQEKKNLKNHSLLTYKLGKQEQQIEKRQFVDEMEVKIGKDQQELSQEQQACWKDSDDEEIDLGKKESKKLKIKDGQHTQEKYQGKLKRFYNKKFGMKNWALQGKGEQQKDLTDYMNEELHEVNKNWKQNRINVQFFHRTSQCHESVVTGIDWKKHILFSTGLDHKLKIWSIHTEQSNPELKCKLQKDVFFQDLPLSCCYSGKDEVYCGTLRKNIAILNYEKWQVRYATSVYMNKHKNYQNLKMNKNNMQFSLFSQNYITLLDKNFSCIANLQANQQLTDICYQGDNKIFGISDESFYSWDLRMMRVDFMSRCRLGFTKIDVNNDQIAIGSKLGMVYIYDLPKQHKNYSFTPRAQVQNMTTHITSIDMQNNKLICLSKWKNNGGRIIDVNVGRCIGNWPTIKTKINFPMCGKFTEGCQLMGIGSTNGYVSIFKLSHE